MRLLLLVLLITSTAYGQYTHSFYGTPNQGIPRHAILAPSNGTSVFATVHSNKVNPIPGELILTIGELNDEGETYDYFQGDLSFLPDNNYCISGYALNNDELILALIGESQTSSSLFYVRFNRTTNSILQVESSPHLLKNGFVRSKQSGNDLVTYAINTLGEFVRMMCNVSDVSVMNVESVATVSSSSSNLVSGRKKVDFIVADNGIEFVAREQNLYKRSLNGNYLSQTVLQWSPFKGYDLSLNASNDIVVLNGTNYSIYDSSNLALASSGPIVNMFPVDYRYLEFVEDQQNVYVFATPQTSLNTVFFRIDANMVMLDSIDLKCQISPIDVIKKGNFYHMIGTKTEPASNLWGIGASKTLLGSHPQEFREYNSSFSHHSLKANTGHLNVSFHQQNNGIHGLGRIHNGVEKSVIYSATTSILGKDLNDSISGLVSYFSTDDVLPGPYMPENGPGALESYDKHNRAFYVTRDMIDYHRQFAIYPWYEAPFGIKHWPGNGDVINGQAQNIAPFYDENNDGMYEPDEGDYPLIYGDRCYLNVYHLRDSANDNGSDNHLEVHQYMYTYDCDTSEVLRNTIFMNQRFVLREGNLDSAYISSYMDADLGNFSDDFVGSNVELGMVYTYNGDLLDEAYGGRPGFNDTLPAVGLMTLKGAKTSNDGMDNPLGIGPNECTNGFGYDDGVIDNEYYTLVNAKFESNGSPAPQIFSTWYNYYQGLNWDGSPQLLNGVTIRHAYFGESDLQFYSSNGIDPGTSNYEFGPISTNPPGDRRVSGGTGPITLNAADPNNNSVMITNAYVVAIDTVNLPNGNLLAPVDYLFELGSDLKAMYNSNDAGCDHDFDMYITPVPVGLEEHEINAKLYPNPTFDEVNIVVNDATEFTADVYDLNGSKVYSQSASNELKVNTSNWQSGIYMVVIQNGNKVSRKKLVKM